MVRLLCLSIAFLISVLDAYASPPLSDQQKCRKKYDDCMAGTYEMKSGNAIEGSMAIMGNFIPKNTWQKYIKESPQKNPGFQNNIPDSVSSQYLLRESGESYTIKESGINASSIKIPKNEMSCAEIYKDCMGLKK